FGFCSASASAVVMPMAFSRSLSLRPTPQTSLTGIRLSSFFCRIGSVKSTTPRVAGYCLAAWFASLARVLLGAIPTHTVMPMCCCIVARTCRSEEHTSELQSRENLVCRLLLEKKKDVED